jgi:hypothetical protein
MLALALGFVTIVAIVCAVVRADEIDNANAVLVLKDGGVLTGQITRAADWYVVSRGGGEMQIAQSRVMLVCRSLEEAYQFRREQLNTSKVEPHLTLADWCLRYSLLAEARRELDDARQIDPDHPRIGLLERRLEKMRAEPATKSSVSMAAKNPTGTAKGPEQAPATTISTSDLPANVVERFTRKVQPILVNNCTTSGCHQLGGGQAFQLDRALLRGEANRRSTIYNLEAALTLVDRERPQESKLLVIPRKTHGGMPGPILGPRHEQAFKHVVDWVALVVPPPEPVDAAAADDGDKSLPDTEGNDSKLKSPIRAVNQLEGIPTLQTQPPSVSPETAAVPEHERQTLRPPHRLQFGARLETWQPRDPFDPEIFNRKTRRPVASTAAVNPEPIAPQR